MPTLGSFLKKKRTKDLQYPNDSNVSNSPVGNSPTTPTSSGGFKEAIGSSPSHTTPPQTQNVSNIGDDSPSQGTSQQPPPTSAARSAAQETMISPPKTQNAPTISNLIHPPQTDGAAQPQAGNRSNGSDLRAAEVKVSDVPSIPSAPAVRATKGKYTLTDFAIQRTLGTGSFGRVHLVQSNHNHRFYAVKVLKKQQVVKMKQIEHTNDERRMLQKVKHPFLVTLWGTFQDSKNLYMVMDFVEGGELFSLLRKSQVGDVDDFVFCHKCYTF